MFPKILKTLPLHKKISPLLSFNTPNYQFVIMKLLKKKFKVQQQKYEPKPHTYSYTQTQKKVQEPELQEDDDEPDYDFFTRQKQMDLNKDFRKMKLESRIIPEDVGKGGFDEIVYWSQGAKTPEQIIDLVRAFNRVPYPKKIDDMFSFEEFGTRVLESVYLASTLQQLQEYASFGRKFNITDPLYWRKIEQKTVRLNKQVEKDINNCIQIAYIMSKMKQGEQIFSTLSLIFKKLSLSLQHTAKLLIVYYNIQNGDKTWIQELQKTLIAGINKLNQDLLIELLQIFKQLKTMTSQQESKVIKVLGNMIDNLNYRQLCIVGGYIGHDNLQDGFWKRIQRKGEEILKSKKINNEKDLVLLLELLSSYSLSSSFVRNHLIGSLRANDYQLIHRCIPQIRSYAAKIIFIYELQKQAEDIEQVIQTSIIKQYNKLNEVDLDALIKILRDYAVTRNGSRQFYIFLEEVIKALLEDLKKDRNKLQQLYTIYKKSNLCTPYLLEQIEYYLQ